MTTQPEALRLADELKERFGNTVPTSQAAAELRRLHAENERLRQINQSHEMKLSVRGYEIQIADLEAQRDALKAAAEKGTEYVLAHINQDLRAERDALLDALRHAAEIAHNGGLQAMTEWDALVAVRQLTLLYFVKSGGLTETHDRLRAAMLAAREVKP